MRQIILLAVSAFTICWLIVIFSIAEKGTQCAIFLSGYRFESGVFCFRLNEIGDFLAGSFSPLAFVWLAAAVFLQSMELKSQGDSIRESTDINRSTLELTQEELLETRESTVAIKNQSTLLKRQIDLLEEDEYDLQMKTYKDALFVRCQEDFLLKEKNGKERKFLTSKFEKLESRINILRNFIERCIELEIKPNRYDGNNRRLFDIRNIMNKMQKISDKCSESNREWMALCRLHHITELLDKSLPELPPEKKNDL